MGHLRVAGSLNFKRCTRKKCHFLRPSKCSSITVGINFIHHKCFWTLSSVGISVNHFKICWMAREFDLVKKNISLSKSLQSCWFLWLNFCSTVFNVLETISERFPRRAEIESEKPAIFDQWKNVLKNINIFKFIICCIYFTHFKHWIRISHSWQWFQMLKRMAGPSFGCLSKNVSVDFLKNIRFGVLHRNWFSYGLFCIV